MNIPEHASTLKDGLDSAISASGRQRAADGIDPSRLLVLSFLIEADERELIEKLGMQIVQERLIHKPIEEPYYSVSLVFEDESKFDLFQTDANDFGVIKFDLKRESSGFPSRTKIDLRFRDLDTARAFVNNADLQTTYTISKVSKPNRKSSTVEYSLLVQFPTAGHLAAFKKEFGSYGTDSGDSALTEIQRQELFDAIDTIAALSSEDRMGSRLATEGPPQTDQFYIDVDLWHPGSSNLIAEAINQFKQVVQRNGGSVTDAPHPVAGTLLIARVRGSARTLEALLNYDRVARVDLPPIFRGLNFATWASPEIEVEVVPPQEDGPIACVVDSGVIASHPLLSGSVLDERDFDSGEQTVLDRVGHGTHVAGIVTFGDIPKCFAQAQWHSRVRLLSAKVMRRIDSVAGGQASAGFADETRVETQLREAITTFHEEYGCRVYNLSLGNSASIYGEKGQLPWAYVLDELARELDIVIVVAAGNVTHPLIPAATTETEFQELVREQLFSTDHHLIDPASAVLALTVGSLVRPSVALQEQRNKATRVVVGSPDNCPSPFTRTSIVDSTGDGLRRVIKPELVSFGGNYSVSSSHSSWNTNDPGLGEVSLKHDHQSGRLFSAACGTSGAAPYVTHTAALVEDLFRKRTDQETPVSANLIRALVVHSADRSKELEKWISDGFSKADAEDRLLRSVGYGKPDPYKACFSDDKRAVLFAEDVLEEDHFHLYELEIPDEFIEGNKRRKIKITLAYDPPLSGTRKEYLSRTMWFELYRGLTPDQVKQARSAGSSKTARTNFGSKEAAVRPTYTTLQWSTVQSAIFTGKNQSSFEYRAKDDAPVLWHILVGSTSRFEMGAPEEQRYALVVSLEHSDAEARIYLPVRQKNVARVRQHWS